MDDKRFYRELKRNIKKTGNRKRRQFLKRALAEHPDDAHEDAYDFGRDSSALLNGVDDAHRPPQHEP
jgi:hypothetical protein